VSGARLQSKFPTAAGPHVEAWMARGRAGEDLPAWFAANGFTVSSAAIDTAPLCGPELEEAAEATFGRALSGASGSVARVWAFLPRITDVDRDGLDRYMWMNRGRRTAYSRAGLSITHAGTCTGHAGRELVVHVLGTTEAFRPVENPRQRPAWNYSARFGPAPPPFTRGVVMGNRLITSGTASVVGESTVHDDLPRQQWDETMRNLEALCVAAECRGAWRSMRLYVRDAAHLAMFGALGEATFGAAMDSVLLAPLCRSDLLVEVEGVRDA
jgi:chorismate lyase/3-hydroxybenzoate synthase